MIILNSLVLQAQGIWRILVTILGAYCVLIGLALIIHYTEQVPVSFMTRDPVAVLNGPVYTGLLSQIGIFFWTAAATACLMMPFVLPSSSQEHRFYLASGLLSLLLGLDDIFLLHENVLPYLGIPEKAVYLTYLSLAGYWLVSFRSIILRTEFLMLLLAGGFLGLSVLLDIGDLDIKGAALLEDGPKLLGIMCWLSYFFRAATLSLRNISPQTAHTIPAPTSGRTEQGRATNPACHPGEYQ